VILAVRGPWSVTLLSLLLFLPASARAQGTAYLHVVQAGETLTAIAELYFGDPQKSVVLASENGLSPRHPALHPGMHLVIPFVRYHRTARGESWSDLAARYYGDPTRVQVLVWANAAHPDVAPVEGTQLLIPYPLRHMVHASSESLSSIAAQYYGKRDEVRRLRSFNAKLRERAPRGQVVLVPLSDLVLSQQGQARVETARAMCTHDGDEAHVQAEIAQSLPRLHEYVARGRYVDAVALGNQLLSGRALTSADELSVLRNLAVSYVALGRTDLATAAFMRALEKDPALELDALRTSPRVLSALEAAKAQRGH
jgi:tetratricopeptide (TPR) repeat protein